MTDEIEIGTEHSSTSLYIAFITHSGFDYTKLQQGYLPDHPVAYQAYILAHATSVITQNGSINDPCQSIMIQEHLTHLSKLRLACP